MGSIIDDFSTDVAATFEVLDDARANDTTLPAFLVSKTRGFLPRADPVATLPPAFAPLESLLARMPVQRLDGEPGLLADGGLGDAVLAELPDLSAVIDNDRDVRGNLPLVNALYRDYSFLASAYLLEPCHLRFLRGEPYGLGRDVLPAAIARPIARCAKILGFQPFMEYAGSYALYNYQLADPQGGMAYDNLRLIRAFEHGLDPTSSEAGFVLVHIDMVKNSGPLVAGTVACLEAAAADAAVGGSGQPTPAARRAAFNAGLAQMLAALRQINGVMETMWAKSRPEKYTSFRTFIFGITSQSMFPDGVAYEGIVDEAGVANPRLSFRGESGANDSMIPLMDNFLEIAMPDTPLTEILRDFRKYRPSNHRAFLAHVRTRAATLGVKRYALALPEDDAGTGAGAGAGPAESSEAAAVVESARLWLQILNQVRDFRWRHWCFGKEYILKRTAHPTATGGSPIVTWLPNQLQAVLREMQAVYAETAKPDRPRLGDDVDDIMDLVRRQEATLAKEVARYCEERGV